ncbi:hypothetical protein VNO78_25058 [Psophocarpus tetragonolobus]|uniref:Transmembrane protein n=1 Tax=Psophocarpus tetragonolobus TaxID=3891 RepID=A0AAN9S6L6_PSOTE
MGSWSFLEVRTQLRLKEEGPFRKLCLLRGMLSGSRTLHPDPAMLVVKKCLVLVGLPLYVFFFFFLDLWIGIKVLFFS